MSVFALARCAVLCLCACSLGQSLVYAQEHPAGTSLPGPSAPLAKSAFPSSDAARIPSLQPSTPAARRPSALMPLYVSFASLQVLDVHSTRRALGYGAVEANPVMRGVTGSSAGMLALKAAGTAGVFLASEKMWKRNKAAAVIFMVAANSAMAVVVQHNYRAVR